MEGNTPVHKKRVPKTKAGSKRLEKKLKLDEQSVLASEDGTNMSVDHASTVG